jgi:hypothetical protein
MGIPFIQGGADESLVTEMVDVIARSAAGTAQTSANNAQTSANNAQATANSALALAQASFQGFSLASTSFSAQAPANGFGNLASVTASTPPKGGVALVFAYGNWNNGTVPGVIPTLQIVDGNGVNTGVAITTTAGGGSPNTTAWAIIGVTTTGNARLQGKGSGLQTNTITGFMGLLSGS